MKYLIVLPLIAVGITAPSLAIAQTQPSMDNRTIAPPKAVAATVAVRPTKSPGPRRLHRPPSAAVTRVAAANLASTQQPQTQGFVNAVQIYPFSTGAIYQLYTAPGAVSDIALQPGETLVSVASGDTARWVIGDTTSGSGADKRTHVLIKPFASGLATNVVITTDRRSYHLQLTATARTAMAALSWTYPADELIALRRAAEKIEVAAPIAEGLAIDRLRFNYVVSGDRPGWRPLRVFDDGRQTFIEFPASIAVGEAPPLFVVGAAGEAELANYRMRGRFYVIDRLFDVAELRLGTKRQQIVRIERIGEDRARRTDKRP